MSVHRTDRKVTLSPPSRVLTSIAFEHTTFGYQDVEHCVSLLQASSVMKGKDAFSLLYEAACKGAKGQDCTMEVTPFCLDLMHRAAHNEL